jgi:hypothetical protein
MNKVWHDTIEYTDKKLTLLFIEYSGLPGSLQSLGSIDSGAVVINCATRLAYLFPADGTFLHPNYVKEKLGGNDLDARMAAELISKNLGRRGYADTEEAAGR